HTTAGYTMLTGVPHPNQNSNNVAEIRPLPSDHPHLGCVLAKVRPPRSGPAFASLPEVIKDAGVNEFPGQGAGFLGGALEPWRIEGDIKTGRFRQPGIALPDDVTPARLADRRLLLGKLDRLLHERDGINDKAFDLIRSPAVKRALDLGREPARVRQRYGPHLFGQGCLMGRRLLEAGVPWVAVYWPYEGPDDSPVWDTHENNFPHLRKRLMPPTDLAVSAVMDDLSERGLLDDTLVIVMGEFGRSPKVNAKGGREHWPQAQSILLAGAGMRGGAYGSTDRIGGVPATDPVAPPDLAATFLHLLGIDPSTELIDKAGRPHAACAGKPVAGLMG
ncbi:MAG: DUF1501 domain-containing protein, partial [Gemmataceae bacterium]|nr:DUF1501 domain-containing protein [Gemmataceae bacterium]